MLRKGEERTYAEGYSADGSGGEILRGTAPSVNDIPIRRKNGDSEYQSRRFADYAGRVFCSV